MPPPAQPIEPKKRDVRLALSTEKLEQYFSKMWKGDKGETYSFEPSGDKTWVCTRTDSRGGFRKFTVWLDEHSGLVWWGSMFYYFDPRDWIEAPGRVAWYGADDKDRKRARFVWKALEKAVEENIEEPHKTPEPDIPVEDVEVMVAEHNSKFIRLEEPPQEPTEKAKAEADLAAPLSYPTPQPDMEAQAPAPETIELPSPSPQEEDSAAPGCGPGWYPPPGLTRTGGKPWAFSRANAGSSFSFFRSSRFGFTADPGTPTAEEVAWREDLDSSERIPTPPPGLHENTVLEESQEVKQEAEKMGKNKMGRNKMGSNILTNLKNFRPSFGSASFRPAGRVPNLESSEDEHSNREAEEANRE